MTPFRIAIAGILALNVVTAAQAGLSLHDYERWQVYNGWRIPVIDFPGHRSFSRAELLSAMATEAPLWLRRYVRIGSRSTFYADDFAADLIRLEHYYAREGFPHADVRGFVYPDDKRHEVRLKIQIDEGPPTILESWRLVMGSDTGAGVDSARWSALLPIHTGRRLALSDVKTSADTLAYKLREIGHARARVDYEIAVDSVRHTARLTFILYPGHFCYLGQTRILGLKQISDGTARRELTYHELEPYSVTKLEETRKRLVRLEAFTLVSVRADTGVAGDTLPVWIQTEEGNRYRLRLGGGYDTDELWRTSADFTDLNFFGRGRRFTLSGSLAEIRRYTEARLFWPHTPWHVTDIILAPKWEYRKEPGFRLETVSSTTILSAAPLRFVSASVSNEFGRVHRKATTDTLNSEDTYTKSVETFSAGWDTRDHPLVPRKGHFIGLTATESGAFYRTAHRWWRTVLTTRGFYPLDRLTGLAGKAELGLMGPLYDSPVTPIEERFFLGGPTTVRGWNRNRLSPRADDPQQTEIGGNVAFQVSGEVRRSIYGPVTFAVFCDAGNVWRNYRVAQPLNLYPSAGAGLLFISPVGPIRVDYAYQLRPNPYHEKQWAIHFSLGTPF
jgi:outer membrane protein assembly complex protein YaeT